MTLEEAIKALREGKEVIPPNINNNSNITLRIKNKLLVDQNDREVGLIINLDFIDGWKIKNDS